MQLYLFGKLIDLIIDFLMIFHRSVFDMSMDFVNQMRNNATI